MLTDLLLPFILLAPVVMLSWFIFHFLSKEIDRRRVERERELEAIASKQVDQPSLSEQVIQEWKAIQEKLAKARQREKLLTTVIAIVSATIAVATAVTFLFQKSHESLEVSITYKVYFGSVVLFVFASLNLLLRREKHVVR